MSASPKISIVIPVYNVGAYLSTCLRSILGQTLADIEIIAVNDGATDNSAEVLSCCAKSCPYLKIVTQSNRGPSAAREVGTKAANGEFLLFVDGDDVLDVNYCTRLWQVAKQEQADLVLAPVIRWKDAYPSPDTKAWQNRYLMLTPTEQREAVFEDFDAVMPLYGKLVARSLFEKVEERVTSYRSGEDIALSVQLLAKAKKIAFSPQAYYFYRQRDDSQSKEKNGCFEGLLDGFSRARHLLQKQGIYQDVSPGFEYVCRVCLTSFMERYGLTPDEERALAAAATQIQVPAGLFKGRPWRFRFRQHLLNYCLKHGFSYARVGHLIRRFRGEAPRDSV